MQKKKKLVDLIIIFEIKIATVKRLLSGLIVSIFSIKISNVLFNYIVVSIR